MYRALRSILVVVSLFVLASACANSPTDVLQAADGYANDNCLGCGNGGGNDDGGNDDGGNDDGGN